MSSGGLRLVKLLPLRISHRAPAAPCPNLHAARAARGPTRPPPHAERRNLFQKLVELVAPGPDSRDELIETLADAEQRELIAPESRMMLEGVIRMADLTAGDVMVPTPRMDLLAIDAPYDELLHGIIGTGHSRFPVYEGARQHHRHPDGQGPAQAAALARPEPAHAAAPGRVRARVEGLNELLRDFRSNRNHLAIVIDEFGNTAG